MLFLIKIYLSYQKKSLNEKNEKFENNKCTKEYSKNFLFEKIWIYINIINLISNYWSLLYVY